jgi:hypothetical protein
VRGDDAIEAAKPEERYGNGVARGRGGARHTWRGASRPRQQRVRMHGAGGRCRHG